MSAARENSSGNAKRFHWRVVCLLLLVPGVANADVGIPMLAFAWPAAWASLPVVVLLEGVAAHRLLALSFKDSLWLSLRANAWSTLIGIPIGWAAMLALEFLMALVLTALPRGFLTGSPLRFLVAPFYAAWIPPTRDVWPLFAAGLLLCFPFYALSVRLEARIAESVVPKPAALRWARAGNRITYGLFAAGCLIGSIVTGFRAMK